MPELNKNSKILIAIFAIQSVIEMFLNTFLSAHFFKICNNMVPAAEFNMFTYMLLIIGFIAIGPIIKGNRNILIFRLSFLIDAGLILFIILLKNNIINYIWELGLIWGIERILFYFPQNLLTSQIVNNNQLIKFTGYRSAFCSFARIVMPIVLGWFIDVNSFYDTAIFIFCLTILKLILSLMMKNIPEWSNAFNFKNFIIDLKSKNIVKFSLIIDFIRGLTSEPLSLLIVLYVIYIFKTNINLGIVTSLCSICTIVVNAIFGKYLKYNHFKKLLILCGVICFLAAVYFIMAEDRISFIIYNFAFAGAGSLIRTMCNINFYRITKNHQEEKNYRCEYISFRETFINSGRVIGLLMLIAANVLDSQQFLKYLILTFSLLLLVLSYMAASLTSKLNRRFNKR